MREEPHEGGPADGPARRWIVWRQDDNGNRFEVARYDTRTGADLLAATMEARGHKQIYRVAEEQSTS